MLQNVDLRPGVSVDLHVRVFVDETDHGACTASQTAIAVPGFAHTAATWGPFAEALFEEKPQTVCRLVALDLPGHGLSGLPSGGLQFSFLTLDDYVTALLGVTAKLPAHGIEPRAMIGHSQGGMVIQMAQQRLLDQHSSLRVRLGIHRVLLLSPTPPEGLSWTFVQSGVAGTLLGQFAVGDAALGTHFSIPDPAWPVVFFTNLNGLLSGDAPTGADVAAQGFNAPEPLLSALQLVGFPPFGQRPAIDAGIFSGRHGSQLSLISFRNDQLISREEAEAIFAHLTAGKSGRKVHTVEGDEAVHDLYISDPAALLSGTRIRVP
jgi:pimeloyl-ACP methyl ester carboxylesterase